jgi:2-hydroxychromene-2-carboxylate isomerase
VVADRQGGQHQDQGGLTLINPFASKPELANLAAQVMAEKFIDYYDSMSSPWTYLGHKRFEGLAHRYGLTIRHKPMDLLKVWSVSGGLPLKQRAAQRQVYRHLELKRWSEILQVPCNLEPAFHPVADRRACYMVIAAMQHELDWSKLTYALLRAVWVEDRNIGDHNTLAAIADESGIDGKALLASTESDAVKAEYEANTEEAIGLGVFGAPTYVYDGELFWGQDRLLMLDRRLAQKTGQDVSGFRFG